MLHHVSLTADKPREVAWFLADLIGGRVSRFGPYDGAYLAWKPDAAGTAIEVYPHGTEVVPQQAAAAGFRHNYFAQRGTGGHAAISVDRTEAEVLALAERSGWPGALRDRGGFEVIEVWVEGRFLIEVFTPALLQRYLAVVGAPRIEATGTDFESLTLSVRVATDVGTAWRSWSDVRALRRWWPMPQARIDLRVGGAYELQAVLPGDEPTVVQTAGCRVLSYIPDRMLSFTWPAADGDSAQTWVVVTFTEVADGTDVELVHNGFGADRQGQAAVRASRVLWQRVLRQLVDAWQPGGGQAAVGQPTDDLTALSDLVPQPTVQIPRVRQAMPAPVGEPRIRH